MTSYAPPSVHVCPGCHAFFFRRRLRTINFDGIQEWSDHLPNAFWHQPPLVRCSACAALFWLDDIETVGLMPEQPRRPIGWLTRVWLRWRGDPSGKLLDEVAWSDAMATWGRAQYIGDASFADVLYVLERSEGVARDRLLWLRKRIWWEWNNRYRGGRGIAIPRPPTTEERANMEAILDMLREGEGQPDELVLQGELLRLLGRFDEAIAILKAVTAGPYSGRADMIARLAQQRDTQVRLLNP